MKAFTPKSKPEAQQANQERKRPTSRDGLSAESTASRTWGIVDNRPEAIAQRKLQALMDQSPQVQRQSQLQAKINNSPRMKAQAHLQAMIDTSPRQVAQRKQLERMFDPAVQRQEGLEEEDELQMKVEPGALQRQSLEDKELLQGKMEPVQRQGELEEELIQGKFDPVQRQGLEDEELVQGKFATRETPTQRQGVRGAVENPTGMPDSLKEGLEQLSGLDLSGVRVHHNSAKPAQLNALAYAQGQDIHLGPGQERHLPHEGRHAVQQMQGRVKPTMQAQGVSINDDEGLEHEADVMGAKALQLRHAAKSAFKSSIHDTKGSEAARDGRTASLQQKTNFSIGSGFVREVNDSLDTIQRTTNVYYGVDPINVVEHEVINVIEHDRVMHTHADRVAAAAASGYGAIPAGMICNHFESYADVRQRVYNMLIGLDVDTAAGWINAWPGGPFLAPIYVNGAGWDVYSRYQVNTAISDLIEVLANNVNNLYYWPAKTGGVPDAPMGAGPGGAPVAPQLVRLNAYRATLP